MLHPAVPPLAFSSDSLMLRCSAPSFRLSSPVSSPLLIVPLLRIDLSTPRCSGSPLLHFTPINFRCFSSALSYLLPPPPYPHRSVLLSTANFLCINAFNSSCNPNQPIRSFRPTPLKCKLPAKVVLFSHIRNSAE